MTNPFARLLPALTCAFLLIVSCIFPWGEAAAKTVTLTAQPASGVAPLEVQLICTVATNTSEPKSYNIDYGDGSENETVESNQYSHIFTHTYEAGFYRPICSVQKTLGLTTNSDPGKIIVAKWRFETLGDIDSSPAVGPDGTVYVGSDDGNLYAIDPETGTEAWRFLTGAEVRSSPAVGTNGTIYFGSLDGSLYAVTKNGALKWSFNIGDFIFSSPAISADGRIIYVGSSDNNLYAINASGTLKWKYETGDKIVSSPVIGYDGVGDVVYVGSLDNHIYALAANTGKLKWRFKTNTGVYAAPAVGADGKIYVGECETGHAEAYNFMLYCINVDGSKLWEFNGGTGFYSSPAIGPDGLIYVGSWDGVFYALNSDGTTNWSVSTSPPADINSSPAVGSVGKNQIIYVGSKDGNFYAFESPAVGHGGLGGATAIARDDWVFQTGDDILYSSPAISDDGTIYFGSRDDCLYAVNPGNMTAADSPWPMFHNGADHSGTADNISIPDVVSTFPAKNSSDVDINTAQVMVNFSPDIKTSQIQTDSFRLERIKKTGETGGNKDIEGFTVLDWNRYNNSSYNITAVFERTDADVPLEYDTEYQASVTYTQNKQTEEETATETQEEKVFSWSFTTEPEPPEDDPNPSPRPGCFINTISPR